MNIPIATRIVYFIYFDAIIVTAGFVGAIIFISALSGGLTFYTPLVIVVALFLIVLMFLIFSQRFDEKVSKSRRFRSSVLL